MEAGTRFCMNLKQSTARNITKSLIFHEIMESSEPGYDDACDEFCKAAGQVRIDKIIITVGYTKPGDMYQLTPLINIHQVGHFIVRFNGEWAKRRAS